MMAMPIEALTEDFPSISVPVRVLVLVAWAGLLCVMLAAPTRGDNFRGALVFGALWIFGAYSTARYWRRINNVPVFEVVEDEGSAEEPKTK